MITNVFMALTEFILTRLNIIKIHLLNTRKFNINQKIIGIGESGLDFYYNHSDKF